MQHEEDLGGPVNSRPQLRAYDPDAEPRYDAAMSRTELTVREIFETYLAASEKKGKHGFAALAQRYQTLLGITLFKDKDKRVCQKKSDYPGFVDAVLPDDRIAGDCPVSEMKPHYLEDWIDNNPRWTSNSTRKGRANQVNAAFNWAVNGRRIEDNPFRGITYEEAEPKKPLKDDALSIITDVCNKPFAELITFLRIVGRRVGEVCNMNWADIDWQKRTVRVTKFKGRKKLKKDQYYALVDEAVELLANIQRRRLLTEPPPLNGPVFLNVYGTPWTSNAAGNYLRRLKERYNLAIDGTIHGIRHQAVTEMIRNGASVKAASQQAGHASTAITERYYCHMEDAFDEMRAAVEKGVRKLKAKDEKPPGDGAGG